MTRRPIQAARMSFLLLVLIVMALPSEAATWIPWQAAYPVGGRTFGLVPADFNEDGVRDVVTANFHFFPVSGNPPALTLLIGRPDGTFEDMVPVPLATQATPTSLGTGDLNNDGHADLWVFHASVFSVFGRTPAFGVLLGNGDGTFATERVTFIGFPPEAIEGADFDSDGSLDIAVIGVSAAGTGSLQVFAGDGTGEFTAIPPMSLATTPGLIRVADLNNDGHPDLVLGQRREDPQSLVTLLLGTGDHRFVQVSEQALRAEGLSFIELADLNEDGREDLVAAYATGPSSGALSFFPGRAGVSFGPASFTTSLVMPPSAAAFADIDADGHTDMVAITGMEVVVLGGRGNGTFQELSRSTIGDGHQAVLLDDVNRDSRRDLLVTSSSELLVLLGNGDGSFGAPTSRRFLGAAQDGAVVADFDADGHADIAAAMIHDGTVAIAFGDGRDGFGREVSIHVGASPRDLVAADFNRDGRLDLAVATLNFEGIEAPADAPPGSVTVLLGGGDRTFRIGGTVQVDVYPRNMSVGDVNGDAIPDLAVAHARGPVSAIPGSVVVLAGLGDGTLARSDSLQAGHAPAGVALGDLDGDGDTDLAVASLGDYLQWVPGDLSVFPGNGDGTFGTRRVLATSEFANSVAVLAADADSDGRTDLVFMPDIASLDPTVEGWVTVFRGQADGTLGAGESFNVGPHPGYAFIADLDRNGVPDLNIACRAGHITVAGVDAAGRFAEKYRIATRGYAHIVEPGDFDEDGTVDVAVVTMSGLSILREAPVVRDIVVRGGMLSWSTTGELDLSGFNVVAFDRRLGRVQLNNGLIPCGECVTGLGDTYTFPLDRGSAPDLYVETVYTDGRRQRFGPAQRR